MGILSTQVCVPTDFSDEQVLTFAEKEFPCGTTNGWFIRKEGDKLLDGAPERAPCDNNKKKVHIMLDA